MPRNFNEKYSVGRESGGNQTLAGNKIINLNFLNSTNLNLRLPSSKNKQNILKNNSSMISNVYKDE